MLFNYYYFILLGFWMGLARWLLTKYRPVGILVLTLTLIEYLRFILQIIFLYINKN